MVHYKDPEMGIDCYPDIMSRPTGTFSDTKLKLVDNFPGRVRQNPVLYLGLQGCSGKVVFDLSSLRLLKAEPAFAKVNQDYVVAYPKKMASPGSLRGFMLPHEPTEQDFKDMAAMGATLVRYQMTRNTRGFDESRHLDFAAYRGWLEGRLAKLDEILAWGELYGIEVVVDMHYTPGGVGPRRGELSARLHRSLPRVWLGLDIPRLPGVPVLGRREGRPGHKAHGPLRRHPAQASPPRGTEPMTDCTGRGGMVALTRNGNVR